MDREENPYEGKGEDNLGFGEVTQGSGWTGVALQRF
jgi:hypothetical protein